MVLGILCAHAGALIDRFLHTFEVETEGEIQGGLVRFCGEICGERGQQYLSAAVEEKLANCFNFEKACVLSFEEGKLFTLHCTKNDKGELFVEDVMELPLTLGLTGKVLKDKKILVSAYGKNDMMYNAQVDNVAKLKLIENIMLIPLLVEYDKGKVLGKDKVKQKELVGVLQLINYKGGDITRIKDNQIKLISSVIARCMSNISEFTKAFNIMLGLHNKLENTLNIIEDGEKVVSIEGRSLGAQLNDKFSQINKLMGDLTTSKKSQFLKEASTFYKTVATAGGKLPYHCYKY